MAEENSATKEAVYPRQTIIFERPEVLFQIPVASDEKRYTSNFLRRTYFGVRIPATERRSVICYVYGSRSQLRKMRGKTVTVRLLAMIRRHYPDGGQNICINVEAAEGDPSYELCVLGSDEVRSAQLVYSVPVPRTAKKLQLFQFLR